MSQYWKDMFISNDNNNNNKNNIIISKNTPVSYPKGKNITIVNGINEENYDEVRSFINQHNCMSTGNSTLISKNKLMTYMRFDNISLIMRSNNNNKIIGTLISLILPIKINDDIINHGCTTYLNVHTMLRGHGLCMSMIRGSIEFGFKRNIYCDYHTVPFKLGDNSFPISSWYRPLNLKQAVKLGFIYPDYDNPRKNKTNKLKYRTSLPKNHSYFQLIPTENHYQTYIKLLADKKFVFYPDIELWKKWITHFPTFIIYKQQQIVGIVSLNKIECQLQDKIATIANPIICLGDMKSVLPVLIHLTHKLEYEIIYFHQYGDIKLEDMERMHCVKTNADVWFSLYNNRIKLNANDIATPFL